MHVIFTYILVHVTENIIQAQLHVRYDLTNITNRSQTNVRFKECRPYIILDVQLLSELESLAAVPAEMESEQEDLHEERIFLVAEVNINDLF